MHRGGVAVNKNRGLKENKSATLFISKTTTENENMFYLVKKKLIFWFVFATNVLKVFFHKIELLKDICLANFPI